MFHRSVRLVSDFRWNRRPISTIKRDLLREITLKNILVDRSQLCRAKRVVVKLGSAVVTREDQSGLALGRLASIVEQVSELQNEGKQMLMVTSGAVAFGKQKLHAEMRMAMSMRETLSPNQTLLKQEIRSHFAEKRAAAAVGQSGLMALYDIMFSQYGVSIAQVLVNTTDFSNPESMINLRATVTELLELNIIPIVNTNDTIVPPKQTMGKNNSQGKLVLKVKDNDSLAAQLAAEMEADLLVLMSDVDGVYTAPPGSDNAKLLHTFCPSLNGNIKYGDKSSVGLGGMESKVRAASWAVEQSISVVICNGLTEQSISQIMKGRKIGTFFTQHPQNSVLSVETLAANARKGSMLLQELTSQQRADIILHLADLLQSQKQQILIENEKDLREAERQGIEMFLRSRLSLSSDKLDNLAEGLRQIASSSHSILGQVLKHTRISEGMLLQQITVPIGVLLVIFESRPDCLPQVAALAIATGNGLLLKGGKEGFYSNRYLFKLVEEALSSHKASDAMSLITTRDEVSELIQLKKYIDLIIPRGSSQLVQSIQQQSKGIPVLGHSEGICHVYIDVEADLDKAIKIVKDSKCDYPAACNAMETLLLHKDLIDTNFFIDICNILQKKGVKIFSGPRLHGCLTFGPPPAKSMQIEYGSLSCTIEVVNDAESSIEHINSFGSGHTDVIVTENEATAETFLRRIDSACVFHNCSSRFSDGYRFGLGAEVGISTSRIHARGPVGVQGLLTTKWVLRGSGNSVKDFGKDGGHKYVHESLPLTQ